MYEQYLRTEQYGENFDLLPQFDVSDGRALTFAEIVQLSDDAPGTTWTTCPYCAPDRPRARRLRIVRNAFDEATYECLYCGESGRVAHGGDPADADTIADWGARHREGRESERREKTRNALTIWSESRPLTGTSAQRYLELRGITQLPPNVDEALRYHPRCPFGRLEQEALVALYRNPLTGNPTGIHRTRLPANWSPGTDVERWELGRPGAIQLWPADGDTLVVGEGIETVLAAAQSFSLPRTSKPLRPAWALGTARNLRFFPVLPDISTLVILVDHDASGVGQKAALQCQRTWEEFSAKKVLKLTPKKPGTDFNDLLLESLAAGGRR